MAGSTMSIQLKGFDEFEKKLKNSPQIIEKAQRNMLEMATFMAQGEAKVKAPIDTGKLRASITSKIIKRNNEMVGVVGTNLDHAPYQEYGTGIFGPFKRPIRMRGGGVMSWNSKSGKKMFVRSILGVRAKHFMQSGFKMVSMNKDKIYEAGFKVIKKGLGF